MKRELKRRIKQDEFVSGFEQVWLFVQNRRAEEGSISLLIRQQV